MYKRQFQNGEMLITQPFTASVADQLRQCNVRIACLCCFAVNTNDAFFGIDSMPVAVNMTTPQVVLASALDAGKNALDVGKEKYANTSRDIPRSNIRD